jgi:hypothetical protein
LILFDVFSNISLFGTGDSPLLGEIFLIFTHERQISEDLFYVPRSIKAIEHATAVYPVFNMNHF